MAQQEVQYVDAAHMFEFEHAAYIDVRDHDAAEIGSLEHSVNIPVAEVSQARLAEFSDCEAIMVYCKSSKQRAVTAYGVVRAVYPDKKVFVVRGGIIAIAEQHPDKIFH